MRFERDAAFFLGAFTINFGIMLTSIGAYIGVSIALTTPDPPALPLALGGVLVAVGVPVACYPVSRTLWSAIDLWMKPLEPKEIAAAERHREHC